MMIVRIFLLWLMLLPWCLSSNESDNDKTNVASGSASDHDFMVDNEIYGNTFPTRYPTTFSDVDAQCAGGRYIRRSFSHHQSLLSDPQSWLAPIMDVSEVIAGKLKDFTTGSKSYDKQVTMLLGDPLSGKSVALAKIENILAASETSIWIVRIHLDRIYPATTPLNDINFEGMVERCFKPDRRDSFKKLMLTDPKKIILLFDGMEHLLVEQAKKVSSIIRILIVRRVIVVVTGRPNTKVILNRNDVDSTDYIIGEMTYEETEEFLSNIWREKLKNDRTPGPSSGVINQENIESRLKEYAQAFTHVLFMTPLSRQPVALMILADVFKQKSLSRVLLSQNTDYPITCFDYVLNPSSSSPPLSIAIEHALLDKNAFYEKIVERFRGNVEDLTWGYGVLSLATIIRDNENIESALQIFKHFDMAKVARILRVDGNSVVFENTIKYKAESRYLLMNKEFMEYFAAKLITSSFHDGTASISIFKQCLENDGYYKTLEFINYQVKKLPPLKQLFLSPASYWGMLKKIHQYRFEYLFRYIYEGISDIMKKNRQLAETLQNIFFTVQVETDRKPLGMIRSAERHPNPFESPSTSVSTATPMEIWAKYGELPTLKLLRSSRVLFDSNKNKYLKLYPTLLRSAVLRAAPNLDVVKFFMENIADITPDYLSILLYDTINDVGDGCQPIANYLVNRGAQSNVRFEGRNLLHVAVQWNSANLLSFLVEKLRVPPIDITDNFGMTLFSAALDANPSSLYTFPGWWEMMAYLVDHVNFIALRIHNVDDNEMLDSIASVPKETFESAEVRLMTLNAGDVTVKVLPNHRYDIVLRPMEQRSYSPTRIMHYTRFIPFTSWRNVDSRLLALRQNFYLRDTISLVGMLAQYRGVHSLQPSQRQYFNTALNTLMTRERDSLTHEAQSRIYKIFWSNVRDIDDFYDCLKFIRILGPTMTYEQIRALIQGEVSRWQTNLVTEPYSRQLTIIDRLTQFRTDFIKKRFIKNEVINMIQKFSQQLEILGRGGGSKDLLFECVKRNRRRSIRVSSSDCRFSREDIDQFDDAVTAERGISDIRVNSDKFLRMLGAIEYVNPGKANQLLSFVRQLQGRRGIPEIITGQSQMVVHDLLRYESLSGYRQNRRFAGIINELWHPLPNTKPRSFRFPSRTAAFYAASIIPIIRGIYATVQTCLQQNNDTDNHSCKYSSGILALSVTLGPVAPVAVKYVPWMVNKFSQVALDVLPSTSPIILRQNIKLIRHYGLKYGAKTAMAGLAIAGIGFDLYNIVEMSKMINMCKRQGDACTSRDEIELIISLTFSCVSIVIAGGLMMSGVGFIPGLLIGLGLMLSEMFATGINDVIYYNNKYETNFDENARIFFHKIGFQSPPADVQALARRTDWIEVLQKRVNQFLRERNENVVAYGVGIGNITNDGVIAGFGYIDMENDKLENTRGLSRVLPKASDNLTLLCLPHQDIRQVYEKYSNEVTDAKYRCDNTFVIANKQRWNTRTSDKSYIIYDLGLVESGTIVGSNTLNNLFLVHNGTMLLSVVGGSGNITNIYMIQNGSFHGSIIMYQPSSKNILHLSSLESPYLYFKYNIRENMGKVKFGKNLNNYFYLYTSPNTVPNLHVIGRTSKPDIFACNYHEQQRLRHNKSVITIDGGGGQSSSNMDYVIDCKISVIHPFTYITSSRFSNSLYTTQMRLEYSSSRNAITTEYATINSSKQSIFIVTFSNVPLFASSHGVKYIPTNKTLMWKLQYSKSSALLLSIVSYRSAYSTSKQNSMQIEVVNCIFIDSYSASTIYPVINLPADGISTITIQQFNVFARVNSSQLMDVISHYNNISIFYDNTLFIVTKLTNPKTGENFMFGSTASDRFYIDNNTMYLFGGEGSDVYVLVSESPNYVWIDNLANDNALDTLAMLDSSCDILWATRGSDESSYCNSSPHDVTLSCSSRTTMTSSPHINVILRNYLVEPRYRHLQIYWRDATYVLLSDRWSQKSNDSNNTDVKLALFCSFSHQWQTLPTTLTLTSHDTYVVFNGTDDVENLLVAYREQSNIILAKKYFNCDTAFFIKLENFFSNDTNDIAVSTEWQQLKIFSVDNFKDDADPKILTAEDILHLFFNTHFTDLTGADVNADFTKEYFVNMNDTSKNNTIVIEHEPRSMINNELDQLGVLVVTGATPGEFQADWNHHNRTALTLCARQTCIIIKNWCRSIRHRLYRMEFVFPLYRRPIVISNMDQLDCQEQVNNRSVDDELLKQLNEKFAIAQKQFLLTDEFDDNDDARLLRCIGSIVASNISDNSSMYRVFGFASSIDQANFMHDNCPTLCSRKNIEKLSFTTMNTTLENAIEKFQLSEELTQEEQKSILLLRKSFKQLYNHCWDDLKFSLNNHDNRTESNANIVTLQALSQISRVLSKCIHELQ